MAEIIHGKQYGIPVSANTAGRHIEKSQRFEETSIKTNYAVWEVCYTVSSKYTFLTCLSLRYTLDCFNDETRWELLFCKSLQERCTGEDSTYSQQ